MNTSFVENLLKQYGLKPKKMLGQNFLLNDVLLTDIADSVPVSPKEAILEIGPGVGNLTARLLERADFVLAVERDESFKPILAKIKKQHKNFRFEFADILNFDFQSALSDYKNYHVVANIPYYITGKIVQLFLHAQKKPKSMTLLVQKEVAENITAKQGRLNLLALSIQLYGSAKVLFNVPRDNFFPVPKVDSTAIQISLAASPKVAPQDEKKFFSLLRACFAGKRKQLHNTLVNNAQIPKTKVNEVLLEIKISPASRPQELSLETWLKLYQALFATD